MVRLRSGLLSMKTFHYLIYYCCYHSQRPPLTFLMILTCLSSQLTSMPTQPIHYINYKPNLNSKYLMVPVEDRVVVDEDYSLIDLLLLSSFSMFSSYIFNDPDLPVLPTHQHAQTNLFTT